MRAILNFLINPFSWYMILFLVIGILILRKDTRSVYRTFILAVIIFLSSSMSFIPNLLTNSLEKQNTVLNTSTLKSNNSYNILVLGAGFSDNTNLPATQRLRGIAMGRLIEGIRIQKELPGSTLIVTGNSGKTLINQSQVMADVAYELGADSLLQLSSPENTATEVEAYVNAFGNNLSLILITDAVHMPRAIANFEAKGIKVIPAPTNLKNKNDTKKYKGMWLPSSENVTNLNTAIKEYIGLIIVHLKK